MPRPTGSRQKLFTHDKVYGFVPVLKPAWDIGKNNPVSVAKSALTL
jgi:hypothetical protein